MDNNIRTVNLVSTLQIYRCLESDGNLDLQNFIKDGTLQAIAVQSSYQMGQKGIEAVVGVIEKKAPPKFVDTGVVMVDKANIDLPVAKNVLY